MELVNIESIKKKSKSKNKSNHLNDAYLGEGSFGCVLTPEIKCNGKETIINSASKSKKSVSKIFISKEDYNQEINASKIVKKVDSTGKNILLPYKGCEVKPEEILKNNQAYKCDKISYKNKFHNLYQLIMPYGGRRYDDYMRQYTPTLKEFMYISEPLFKALILLEEKHICHYDIRGANVLVGSDKKAIIIDHSLIIKFEKLYNSKNLRRLKKSYYPYPPECIIYYQIYKYKANFDDFINTQFDESINNYGEKRYEAYKSLISNDQINEALNNVTAKLVSIANTNTNAHNKEDIKETSYQNELYTFMTKYANRLDVYSVGMLIVTVYLYIDYSGVSKNIKDEFKTFIKQLIEPDIFKRVSPLEAYANFKKLYSKL